MAKKKLPKPGGLEHQILNVLYSCVVVSRQQILYCRGEWSSKKNAIVRKMIANNWIDTVTIGNDHNMLRMTREGRKVFYEVSDVDNGKDPYWIPYGKFSDERHLRFSKVMNLCNAAHIFTFEPSKPKFDTLLAIMNGEAAIYDYEDFWADHRPSVDTLEALVPMLQNGIFYSSIDIKNRCKLLDVKEQVNKSRIVGIIVRQYEIVFCYNTLSSQFAFETVIERNMVKSVLQMFRGYDPYRSFNDKNPKVILFGNTCAVLPPLVTTYKWGKRSRPRPEVKAQLEDSQKEKNTQKREKAVQKFNAYSNISDKLFFVPTNMSGVARIKETLNQLNEYEIHDATRDYFKKGKTHFFLGIESNMLGRDEEGVFAALLNIYELKHLRELRHRKEPIDIFVHREDIKWISKVLGPTLRNAYTLDGKQIQGFQRFDYDGNEL